MSQEYLRTPSGQHGFDKDFHKRVKRHIRRTFYDCVVENIHEYMKGSEGAFRDEFCVVTEFSYRLLMNNNFSEFKEHKEHRVEVLTKFFNRYGWEFIGEDVKSIGYGVEWCIHFKAKPYKTLRQRIKEFFNK